MRISDWSSDVCSSDLLVEVGEQRREGPFRRHWNTTFHGLSSATCALFITAPFASAVSTLETTLLVFAGSTSRLLAREVVMARNTVTIFSWTFPTRAPRSASSKKKIRRASCRERVCQYV